MLDRFAYLEKQRQAFALIQPRAIVVDRHSVDQFEYKIGTPRPGLAAIEQARDIWVFECRQGLALLLESGAAVLGIQVVLDDLDGDSFLKVIHADGFIDRTHPTLAYLAKIGRPELRKPVFAALVAAFVGSIGIAILLSRTQWNQDIFEGWVMLAAAFFVCTMIVFMMKTGRQLLSAAGVSNLKLRLAQVSAFPYSVSMSDILGSQLQAIGVQLDVQPMEFPRWLQTVFTGAVIVLAVLMNSIQYGRRAKSS